MLQPDLRDVLTDAFTHLQDGADNPGSPFRNLALGTVGLDDKPQVRTVVVRHFDRLERLLEVHTDARSAKHQEMSAQPFAVLHGWDPASRVQLRVPGAVTLHTADDVARAAWAGLREESRETYRVEPGPGRRIDSAAAAGSTARDDAAFAIFCVVRLRFHELEYLQLSQPRHRRARFGWAGDSAAGMWLVP